MPDTILITGATGFVGQYLTRFFSAKGDTVVALVRKKSTLFSELSNVSVREIADIVSCDWSSLLVGVTHVIHCAALAHIPNIQNQKEHLWQINFEATQRLAKACEVAQVKRFIFLSSIKVLGEFTENKPFSIEDKPFPCDLYGESKWAAEEAIRSITNLNWVILRPSLIYGPGLKGNLQLLIKALEKGFYLPLRSIKNKRSLFGLRNLASLIEVCLTHPHAIQQAFLGADIQAISTPELIHVLAKSNHLKAKLFSFPLPLLYLMAICAGKVDAFLKLTQSLEVDISHTTKKLQWSPPVALEEGLSSLN